MVRKSILVLGWLIFLSVSGWAGAQTPNGFLYKPDLGARGGAEKNLYDAGLDRVDDRLGKEIWVGDPNYGATLQTAITAIGTTPAILRVPAGTHPIADNLTIPATLTVKPERGAVLAVATTKTLTVSGGFEAGIYQVFSCTGTGKVAFGKVKELHPEWWGITGTADNVAINAAIVAASGCKATVKLAGGSDYTLADQVLVPNGTGQVAIEGYGASINGAALNKPIFQVGDFTGTIPVTQYIRLSGFVIYGAGCTEAIHTAFPLQDGLTIGNSSTVTVRDLKIVNIPNVGINGKKSGGTNRYWDSISFYNIKVSNCGSSGMSIGRLNEDDTDVQPADNIYLYNCTFTQLCKGVNRGAIDGDYAGVYLTVADVEWYGGQIGSVGLPVSVDIQGLSSASACTVTWNSHGFTTGTTNGSEVSFSGITQAEWTFLNGKQLPISNVTTNSFTIPIDTSAFASYETADPGVITTYEYGGQSGLYLGTSVQGGVISGVHFENNCGRTLNSSDIVVTGRGISIIGTSHSGNQLGAARTAVYVGSAQSITVINPTMSGGQTRQYVYGVNVSNSRYCSVINPIENGRTYPMISAPGAPTGTPSISGGHIPDGTYFYKITAYNASGETLGGTESAKQVINGGSNYGSVALSWSSVSGATSYIVYRTTVSGQYVTTTYIGNPSTNSYTDTTATPSFGAPPALTTYLANISSNSVQCYSNIMGHTSAANYLNCQVKTPAIGLSNNYGTTTNVTPRSGYIEFNTVKEQVNYQAFVPTKVRFVAGGSFAGGGENVTVKITLTYNDATTANVTHVFTATGTYWLTDDEMATLLVAGNDRFIKSLAYNAKSDQGSTAVTLTGTAYCLQ